MSETPPPAGATFDEPLDRAQEEAWHGVQRSWGGTIAPLLLMAGVTYSASLPEVQAVLGNTFAEVAIAAGVVSLLVVAGVVLFYTIGPRAPLYVRYDIVETVFVQAVLNWLAVTSDHAMSPVWAVYTLHSCLSGSAYVVPRFALVLAAAHLGMPLLQVVYWTAEGDGARAAVTVVMLLAGGMGFYYGRSFATTMRELTAERERLQVEVGLLKVAEDRRRIARDLHDGLGSELAAIAWRAAALAHRPGTEAVVEDLRALTARATGGIDEIRSVVWALDADSRPWSEVVAYLRGRAQELATPEATLRIAAEGPDELLPGAFTAHYLRFVLEAMRNAAAHGAGPHVDVRLVAGATYEAIVTNVPKPGATTRARVGSGMKNLEARAALMRGTVTVDAQAERFTVHLEAPRPS